ncbi:hypothetical protein BDN70DRAFT_852840 [Pholiota conissans]|uniref:F-box domain-containing protein n=1 Tax=Pholiota conissans TaxID=109636 RepID=A0A9P5Z830_9AGAR|nr:hypothetical protein BDN70DRAFT_852840 [Pholiota conissans]
MDSRTITPLPTSITSRLAPEVLCIVLSNFDKSGRQHLVSFSLVCKSWLPLCRRILFAEIEYSKDFARFLASSPHATETITPHIRKAVLRGDNIAYEAKREILNSISRLSHLTSLLIKNLGLNVIMDCLSIPPKATPSEILSVTRLQCLNLWWIHCSSFILFAEFLDSFSLLQELSLDSVSWDAMVDITTNDGSLPDAPLKTSSLKKLCLSFCHNRMLFNWLLYGIISDCSISRRDSLFRRSFCSLTSLSFPDILPQDADIVGVILATAGETLEYLEIGILLHDFDGLPDLLTLAQNTLLKAITVNQITLFQFPRHEEPSETSSAYNWIPKLPLTARHGSVNTISFKFWISAEDQLDVFPWQALNASLAKLCISKLQFHISGVGLERDTVVAWFRMRLALDLAEIAIEYNIAL